jgi:hypothetical protein
MVWYELGLNRIMAWDSDHCRALVNMAVDLLVP